MNHSSITLVPCTLQSKPVKLIQQKNKSVSSDRSPPSTIAYSELMKICPKVAIREYQTHESNDTQNGKKLQKKGKMGNKIINRETFNAYKYSKSFLKSSLIPALNPIIKTSQKSINVKKEKQPVNPASPYTDDFETERTSRNKKSSNQPKRDHSNLKMAPTDYRKEGNLICK